MRKEQDQQKSTYFNNVIPDLIGDPFIYIDSRLRGNDINMIPKHIAIIMDGNRRWARKQGLPVFFGHQQIPDKVLEPLVDEAIALGVTHLTLWAFSTDNWNRPKEEVHALMEIFRTLFTRSIAVLHKKGAKVNTIGDLSKFDADIQEKVQDSIKKTKNNTKIMVTFALNYGGRDEIIRAINKICHPGLARLAKQDPGSIHIDSGSEAGMTREVTEESFEKYLDTARLPPVDLIIRTGGEKRLSGFLMWQSEYAELYFTDILMPDFTPEQLREAVEDFGNRERRYGK